MKPSTTVGECYEAKSNHGFSGFPVTVNGKIGSKLVGLVTGRDVDFITKDKHQTKVHEVTAQNVCLVLLHLATFFLLC